MAEIQPSAARRFAVQVVRKLRDAGHQAFWAGGCVRDQLLGRQPQDYDVATSAQPDQIRRLFGPGRTLAVGAAFGVITVLGPKRAGTIEVATFRRDAPYSDGRHPDGVTFSTAQEDARRRDFTINGLFYDPLAERVIDFVGGQQDLKQRRIRAIGDPDQRIAEDKLRMLRAVRFAATFQFTLEEATRSAIQRRAAEIIVVSAERIAAELRRTLVHPRRAAALTLLRDTNLLAAILSEADAVMPPAPADPGGKPTAWQRTLEILNLLEEPTFPVALAALLREIFLAGLPGKPAGRDAVMPICRRWKLSNEETGGTLWLLQQEPRLRAARRLAWPQLQRILIADRIEELLKFAEPVARVVDGHVREIDYCRQRLQLPRKQLNPDPLVDGNDLKAAGIPPGPVYKTLLEQTRDAQLNGKLADKQQAIQFATCLWQSLRARRT